MLLKRFYDEKLAQASYLIGCAATGEAAVIDANRDVKQYIAAAEAEGLEIVAVMETHIHADYVSGSRELAANTGAQLYLSDEGDADWKYTFAHEANVTLVKDGSVIRIGKVRLDVVHTPGHTPEHLTFILTDEPASPEPLAAFTGDFIFVGEVGRPDLLEKAAGIEGTMEQGARTLFQSLTRFKKKYPDTLLIFPAHGSGSACGKSLGGVPVSTLGYEKSANWGLRTNDEDEFIETILSGQPEPPTYFREMKLVNKEGADFVGGLAVPPRLAGNRLFNPQGLLKLHDSRHVIVDIRSAKEVAAGFIPGTLNIPLNKAFTTWAGWLLPYDTPLYLLANAETDVQQAVYDLSLIGLDEVQGWLAASDTLRGYEKRWDRLPEIPQISADEAYRKLLAQEIIWLDVRGTAEWQEGHTPGALHIPLGELVQRRQEIDPSRPIVVQCAAGTRSPIAASVLTSFSDTDVWNLTGGFKEYRDDGFPIETAQPQGNH